MIVMIKYNGVELYCDCDGDSDEFVLNSIHVKEDSETDLFDTFCECTLDKIRTLCTQSLDDLEQDKYYREKDYEDELERLSDFLGREIEELKKCL